MESVNGKNYKFINEKITLFINSKQLKDYNFWKTIYLFECDIIGQIVMDQNIIDKKKAKNRFYDELTYLLQNDKNFSFKFGTALKKTCKLFKDQFNYSNYPNNEDTFKENCDIVNSKINFDKININIIPKILIRANKKFYKLRNKINIIDKDDKIGDITKELIYLISQEEGCSYKEFGLSKEIIEILIEILIISNTDSIKENFREFLKSNLFYFITIFNKEIEVDNIYLSKDEIESKFNTNLCKLLKIISNDENSEPIKIYTSIVTFMSLLCYNLININSKVKLLEDIECNNSSSFNNDILCNFINTMDMASDLDLKKIFILALDNFEKNSKLANILTKCSPRLYDYQRKIEFNFDLIHSILNTKEDKKFVESYNKLLSTISIADKKSTLDILTNSFSKIFFKENKNNNTYTNNNPLKEMNVNSLKLYPYSQNLKHPHVYLCISGFTSQLDQDNIEWENFLQGFVNTSDCYFYKWESQSALNVGIEALEAGHSIYNFLKNKSSKTFQVLDRIDNYRKDNSLLFMKTKHRSKFYGKLLAHIIASKNIFTYHSISLVGFSLGCNVIKHCLKELTVLYNQDQNLISVINNIVLIAGATTFQKTNIWKDRFKQLVKGKIINCYSKSDKILQHLFKISTNKEAIGSSNLIYENYLHNFFNVDFSFMKLGHTEYRDCLHVVWERIRFEVGIM